MRQLMSDYAELESLRAKLNGFLLGDPETSDEAVESLKDKRQCVQCFFCTHNGCDSD